MGAAFSGYLGNKIGGPASPYCLPIAITCGIIATIFGAPLPFVSDPNVFYVLLWIYLFFGGCMTPLMTCVMISCVEPEMRANANAVANLSYNLFGYLPAPFVYGLITSYTGGEDSNVGLIVTFSQNIPVVILITGALFYKPDLRSFWLERR